MADVDFNTPGFLSGDLGSLSDLLKALSPEDLELLGVVVDRFLESKRAPGRRRGRPPGGTSPSTNAGRVAAYQDRQRSAVRECVAMLHVLNAKVDRLLACNQSVNCKL